MIRLTIKHAMVQEGAEVAPTATYILQDHLEPNFNFDILEKRMWSMKLSELARLWFLLNRNGNEPDTNAEILSGYEGTDATLEELIPRPDRPLFSFKCLNPLVVAALDERVRRAAAMIVEDAVYDAYLSSTKDVFFALNDPRAAPSGKSLPNVSAEVRKKATDGG